jgi:hypothetical protein
MAIVQSKGYCVNEKSSDTSWNRASDLPICSTDQDAVAVEYSSNRSAVFLCFRRGYVQMLQNSVCK